MADRRTTDRINIVSREQKRQARTGRFGSLLVRDKLTARGNTTLGNAASDVVTVTSQLTASQGGYFADKVGIGTATPDYLFEVESSTSAVPIISIKNTNADANAGALRFTKDGSSAADDDALGTIDFYGENDAGTPESIQYASIIAQSTDISDGAENVEVLFKGYSAGALTEVARINPESPTANTFMGGLGLKRPVFNLDGASSFTATHSMSGLTILTTSADAKTITLPADAAAAIGFNIRIIIGTTMTGTFTITSAASADLWFGGVHIVSTTAGRADTFACNGSSHYQIVASANTKGRIKGGWVELTLIAANKWAVCGTLAGTGTVVTPFA